MVLNERLTTVLIILKIIFCAVIIYTAVIAALFVKDSTAIVQTRLQNNQPPFDVSSVVAAMAGKQTGQGGNGGGSQSSGFPDLSHVTDPQARAALQDASQAFSAGNGQSAVQSFLKLDGILAADGNGNARTTNQQLLSALQSGDQQKAQQLLLLLVQQLSS